MIVIDQCFGDPLLLWSTDHLLFIIDHNLAGSAGLLFEAIPCQ